MPIKKKRVGVKKGGGYRQDRPPGYVSHRTNLSRGGGGGRRPTGTQLYFDDTVTANTGNNLSPVSRSRLNSFQIGSGNQIFANANVGGTGLDILDAGGATYSNNMLVNGICGGSAPSQRQGNMIAMQTLRVRMAIHPSTDRGGAVLAAQDITSVSATPPTTPSRLLRCLVVYDKQPNGAVHNVTDVLLENTTQSHQNLDNKLRFDVLYDKIKKVPLFAGPAVAGSAGVGSPLLWHFNVNLKNRKTTYKQATDGTGVIADITAGSLFMWFITDPSTTTIPTGTASAQGCPVIASTSTYRLKFKDEFA